jgi:hypothetical protein
MTERDSISTKINVSKVYLFLLSIAIILFITSTSSNALDCKPLDPRQELSKDIETDIEGSAKTLFRIGKFEGKFGNKINEEVKNLYSNYPNADQIVLKNRLIYLFCTLLDESTNIEADRKIQMFNEFYDRVFQLDNEDRAEISEERPYFENEILRVEVVSFHRMGPNYTLKLKHINRTGQPIKLWANKCEENTQLLDDSDKLYSYNGSEISERSFDLPHNFPRIISFKFSKIGTAGKVFSFATKYSYSYARVQRGERRRITDPIYVAIRRIKLQ